MKTRKKITSLLGGAAMVAAVAGMTAGTGARFGCALAVTRIASDHRRPEHHRRRLEPGDRAGRVSDAEARRCGYLNNLSAGCGGMHYIVWGDDGGEQYLFDRNYPGVHDDVDGFVRATDRGLEYLQQFVVPASVLNEDTDGTDEVFARARFVDGDCGSRVQNTNVVKGNF